MSLRERHWKLWVMQTARHYGDIVSVIQKTGIENIDNEHRTMVGLVLEINHLIDSLDQSNFSLDLVYQVGELCNRLRDTTHSHFINEENLFNQYQIAGMEVHAHKHHLILDQLDEMIEDLSGGRLNITLTLKEAILEWVVIHINEEDAATFGPQNMARTILNHPESSELYSIFSNTGIPSLDQIYLQLHKEAVVFDTSHEHIHHLQKILELSQKIEKNILTRYKINISENYPIENQQLTVKLENILSFKNEQRQVEFQHWFSDWWSYHFNVHISQFEVSNWMFKAISKSQQPKDLEAIFPLLSIEELDQGRMYTYKIIIGIVKVFGRLEAYDQHEPNILEMKSNLKKLRGHLRFQHEQEEELLQKKPDHIQKFHQDQHREWIQLCDYFAVLMDSSKMALGRATLRKLISSWSAHLLFFDSPDLGPSK